MDNEDEFNWTEEWNRAGHPVAVLRAGNDVVARCYLSPDRTVLRIMLPELGAETQIKVDAQRKYLDFRRNPQVARG